MYALYLESGPQRKKTLAHVLDLLGCVVQADTTDEAVFAILPDLAGYGFSVGREMAGADGIFDSPHAVRAWLAALSDHAGPTP